MSNCATIEWIISRLGSALSQSGIRWLPIKIKGPILMDLLVTGGADYIGNHMVLELLDAGEQVVVLDNLATGLAIPEGVPLVIWTSTILGKGGGSSADRHDSGT